MEPAPAPVSARQGATAAAGDFVYHVVGRNPKTSAAVLVAMVVLIIILLITTIVYADKLKTCETKSGMLGTNPLGNLNTGGNNPMWQGQLGDAGWGGAMHSSYQKNQSRVYGASAEGGHDMAVVPHMARSCGSGLGAAVSPAAVGEANALEAVQALDTSDSAKGMSDDALVRVMNGGGS